MPTNPPRTSAAMSTSPVTGRVARMEAWRVPSWLTPRVAKTVLWTLILAWTAWLASQWIRDALKPSSAPASVPASTVTLDLEGAVKQAASAPLFGEMSPSDVPKAMGSAYTIKLRGVIAGRGGPMVAIVNTGGERDELVQLQAELSPGVVLTGVYPTHVVISRNGVEERVELEPPRSDQARAAPRESTPKGSRSHGQEAPAAPAVQRGIESQPAPAGDQPESRPTTESEPAPSERESEPPGPASKPPQSLGMPSGAGNTNRLATRVQEPRDDSAALFTPGRAQLSG